MFNSKEYYQKNKAKLREQAKVKYQLNKEEKLQKANEWHQNNKDKANERRREYYINNRLSKKPYNKRNKYNGNSGLTKKQRMKLLYDKNKKLLNEYKSHLCCDHCGSKQFGFHHIDPTTKKFGISSHLNSIPFHKILDEIKKCIPLCYKCHTRHHNLNP